MGLHALSRTRPTAPIATPPAHRARLVFLRAFMRSSSRVGPGPAPRVHHPGARRSPGILRGAQNRAVTLAPPVHRSGPAPDPALGSATVGPGPRDDLGGGDV